jgi:hypothetical protein
VLRSAIALACCALVSGCGGDGESRTAATPSATTTATPTANATAEPTVGIDPLEGASTQPVVVKATNRETALLTDVRAARHEGYDRVVFEFRNEVPGYDVRYIPRPVQQDGSGKTVAVEGAEVLQIRMENALDADLSDASAPPTYTGPPRFSPATPILAELVRTGGFEGVLTWVAGVRDRVDFRVSALSAPPRIVVDVRNH